MKKDPLEEVTPGTGSTSKDVSVVGKGKIWGAAEPSQVRRLENKRYEQVWLMCNQGHEACLWWNADRNRLILINPVLGLICVQGTVLGARNTEAISDLKKEGI